MTVLSQKYAQKQLYAFTGGQMIIPRPAEMGSDDGPYWPWVFDMREENSWPCDWAAYYSTDHDAVGEDGIYLSIGIGETPATSTWYDYNTALSMGLFNSWGTKPASNPIFRYTVSGGQTETPCVIKYGNDWALFAQQFGLPGASNQATFRALSTDGLNFTFDKIVLTYPTGSSPGDGHTGYLRMALNNFPGVSFNYVGYSLHGGQGDGFLCQVGCDNPITDDMTVIAVLQKQNGRVVEDINSGWVVKWNNAEPRSVTQVGRFWYMLVVLGSSTAGAGATNESTYWIPLADDGITIVGKPVLSLARGGGAGGIDTLQVANPNLIIVGDTIELVYQATNSSNLNVIAAATLDVTAPQSVTPFDLPEPANTVTTTHDFTSLSSIPADLTTITTGSPTATFNTGLELAGVNTEEIYVFLNAGIVPDNLDYIEWRIDAWRTDSANALRWPVFGLATTKALPSTFTNAIYCNNNNQTSGTNVGKLYKQQIIGGVGATAIRSTNYWGWGYNTSYAADAPKAIGFRYFPSADKFFLIGESGQEMDSITLDVSFDTSLTYYPFFGIACKGAVTEKFDSLTYKTGTY